MNSGRWNSICVTRNDPVAQFWRVSQGGDRRCVELFWACCLQLLFVYRLVLAKAKPKSERSAERGDTPTRLMIGNASIIIRMCSIRRTITEMNTTEATAACITVIRRRCECLCTTSNGTTTTQKVVDTTGDIISSWTYFKPKAENEKEKAAFLAAFVISWHLEQTCFSKHKKICQIWILICFPSSEKMRLSLLFTLITLRSWFSTESLFSDTSTLCDALWSKKHGGCFLLPIVSNSFKQWLHTFGWQVIWWHILAFLVGNHFWHTWQQWPSFFNWSRW